MPEKGVCEMLWSIASVVGFLACLVLIIGLGTRSTARYEMECRQFATAEAAADPVNEAACDSSSDNPVPAVA